MPALTSTLDVALSYCALGLSVVPVAPDGSKRPALASWKDFQCRPPTHEEITRWFQGNRVLGVGVVCGSISGGLEVLDFDDGDTFAAWRRLAEGQMPGVLECVPCVRTPSGGAHVYLFDPDRPVSGNRKLARDEQGRILVETRGEGGFVVAPGSPPGCHPSGRSYEWECPLSGSGMRLEAHEREALIDLARAFHCHIPDAGNGTGASQGHAEGNRPGEDYCRRGPDWDVILGAIGWRCVYQSGTRRLWRRPGKDRGWSGTTGHCHSEKRGDLLYVFTSNAQPLQSERTYSKFEAYATIHHGGDWGKAARALGEEGYGRQDEAPKARQRHQGNGNGHKTLHDTPPRARVQRYAREVPRKVPRWRWQQWLPEGELSILDGDPGLGKSTLTIDLTARVSRGWTMPPSARSIPDVGLTPTGVILITAEDSPEYTVIHRLEAAGADLDRVVFHEGYRDSHGDFDFDLGRDLDDLRAMIAEVQAGLVVIDPVMAFLGQDVDAHKDQDIRRLLRPLAKLAQDTRASILILRHLNKLNGGEALYRGGGSIAIVGAARAAWIAGTDPGDETGERHVLAMNKCNLSARPQSIAYRLAKDDIGLSIAWEGEVDLRANDILGHGPGHGHGRPPEAMPQAIAFLQQQLASGQPVPVSNLRTSAILENLSWTTVQRASKALGVRVSREGSSTLWQLAAHR